MTHASGPFAKFDLSGKTALVTGGATGIGYYMTRALARSGARVMICARRADVLKAAAEELSADPLVRNKILWQSVDLADRGSIRRLADYALSTLDGVDIFIGNAGRNISELEEDILDESIDEIMQVNFSANVELTRAFLSHMRKKKWGRIMFSSTAISVTANALDGSIIYTASKAALNGFTRAVAVDVGHDGITVNSLILGMYLTDMSQAYFNSIEHEQGAEVRRILQSSFEDITALGRLGQCEEVEGLIQLLASDAGSYVTGTNLAIDGGMTIKLKPNPPLAQ